MNLTGPISFSFAFVTSFSGVDARTHTSPDVSLIAVERPPMGIMPKRLNGVEKVQMSLVTWSRLEVRFARE